MGPIILLVYNVPGTGGIGAKGSCWKALLPWNLISGVANPGCVSLCISADTAAGVKPLLCEHNWRTLLASEVLCGLV